MIIVGIIKIGKDKKKEITKNRKTSFFENTHEREKIKVRLTQKTRNLHNFRNMKIKC